MLDRLVLRRLLAGALVLASSTLAVEARQRVESAPPSHLAQSDGRLVEVENPTDGSSWGVWSYRQGAEFDLAIAHRDAESGLWSTPRFLGRADGQDQVQPSLVVDSGGNLYLAYAEEGHVLLTTRPAGADAWTLPVSIAPGRLVTTPALRVVGDRLVVAFRHGAEVEIHALPLLDAAMRGSTIHDAPDPVLESPSSDDKGESGGEDPGYDGSDAPTGSETSAFAEGSGSSQGRGKRTP